jgi:hypothetical protein
MTSAPLRKPGRDYFNAREACHKERGRTSARFPNEPPRENGGVPKEVDYVGIGVSILLIAVGAILIWGVTGEVSGVDIDAVGVILLVVGAIGLVLSMIFWSSWGGPGYWTSRRRTYVDEGPPPV